ncbi:MAG: hypothetical protein ACW99G_02740 [Candidatus Thorarchaeota archaeon]
MSMSIKWICDYCQKKGIKSKSHSVMEFSAFKNALKNKGCKTIYLGKKAIDFCPDCYEKYKLLTDEESVDLLEDVESVLSGISGISELKDLKGK